MDRDDIEGAKAAAIYFMELYPYIYGTGSLSAWHEMSHPECEFCSGASGSIRDLYESGGHGQGGELRIDHVVVLAPNDQYDHYRVGIDGVEEPYRELSSDGKVLFSANGGDVHYNVAVVWVAG